jgi:hypothetical protein
VTSKFLVAVFFMAAGMPIAQADSIRLLCLATVQGQQLAKNFLIDYGKRTVDGIPAQITETAIKWTVAGVEYQRAVYYDHHLDRLAGTYRIDSRGGIGIPVGPPTTFKCEKAPAPRF